MARSHVSTSSGGAAGDAAGGPRAGNTRGRGSRSIKQVATRQRSLLINGVHMRLSTMSGCGGGGVAGRRRPSSPSSQLPLSHQLSSARAPSETSLGFLPGPGLFGVNYEGAVGDGGGDSSWLITAQKGGDQSSSPVPAAAAEAAAAAAAAMAADGEIPSLDTSGVENPLVVTAVLRVPDGGILTAAIDTARSMSRSRSPSRCRSPVSRSPAASRPMSRIGSPLRPRSGGGTGPAAPCPTAPPPPPLPQLPLAPTGSGTITSDVSCVTGGGIGTAAVTSRGGARGRISPACSVPSPLPVPQPPEAWDAHVASMFQWRTEAELAAVQRTHRSTYTPREGTSSPLRAASPEQGVRRRTGGSSSNTQSSSSTGGGDVGPAAVSAVAALAAVMLGPAGTTLPEFVPVPGAGPRVQSRYATARSSVTTEPVSAPPPPPAEAALQAVPGRMAADVTGTETCRSDAGKNAVPAGSGVDVGAEEFLPRSTAGATRPRALDIAMDAEGAWMGHQAMGAFAISPAALSAAVVGPDMADEELMQQGGGGGRSSSLTSADARSESTELIANEAREIPTTLAKNDSEGAGLAVRSTSQEEAGGAGAGIVPDADTAPASAVARSQSPAGMMAVKAAVAMTLASADEVAIGAVEAPPPLLLPSLTEGGAECGMSVSVPVIGDAISGCGTSVTETAPVAEPSAGRLLPWHLRRFTLSTEGSEPASYAANSDNSEDVSPRAHEMTPRSSMLQPSPLSMQQPPLPPPSAPPLAALDPNGHIDDEDGEDATAPTLAMEATRTTNGRRLTLNEALLLSGFGKPQTPALARIERATSRVQNPSLATSRHTVIVDTQPALPSYDPPAPAAAAAAVATAATTSRSLSTMNAHSSGGGGAASGAGSGGGAGSAVHPSGFTLPAPSRLKLTVPPLQLSSQHHHHNPPPPPPPAGPVAAAAPQPQLNVVQKLLSGPLSPRSLAAMTARGSGGGGGSQAYDTAGMAALGRSMGAGAATITTTTTTATATTATATATTTAVAAGLAFPGRSKVSLHSLVLFPQPVTAAGGESLDGGVGGLAGDVGGSLSPSLAAVASVPLPPVQAPRSHGQLPLIHQVHTFPLYSQLQSYGPIYHLQSTHLQQGSGSGAGGGMAGVSVNGISINSGANCGSGSGGGGGSGARGPQLLLQLPPLRDPGSPHLCDSPRPAASATVPPPPPGHKHAESLSDGAAAAAVLASALASAAAAGGQKDSSKMRRGRSAVASSLPALPVRVHSQGSIGASHQNPARVVSGENGSCGGAGSLAGGNWTARAAAPRALSGNTTFVGDRAGPLSPPPPPEHSTQPASAVHRRAAWIAEPAPASVSLVASSSPLAMVMSTGSAAAAASPANAAVAAFAPAPPAAPLVAPVTSLADLPDIVTLLMHETRSPIRIGPTRVRKMDY
ncbi:hypothetical protein Vafri_14212 [Volvox africanus]|uniref:Uncharacterized protein n=2 Tax=Volvox africanus TaxID=51714 RepID=A0A8J4BEX8_9CHLO|nr:hypothetical protein Vafri_14212 [Volvox africanus]